MKLDIGGGKNKTKGFLSVDIREDPETDFVVDLETERIPIKPESISEVFSKHTFEHIDNIIAVMNELWRVMKWDARATIIVPHKDCDLAWQDPTHKRFFVKDSMKYFCGDYLKKYQLDYGIKCCFKLISGEVTAPDGRPDYFKEIKFVLKKEKKHYETVDYDIIKIQEKKVLPREEHFKKLTDNMREVFIKKNKDYGDGYFTGDYSDVERWMSVKRKIARLENFYKQGKLELKDETVKDTWQDLAIYCVMELMKKELDGE